MLYPISKILSPLQFDEHSIAALGLARDFAERNNATIYLLHVVPILPAIGEASITETVEGPEGQKAKVMLEEIAKKYLKDVKHEITVVGAELSETADAVLMAANEIGIDMIVMTTHGRTGLPHLLAGSVCEGVIRGATCPVVIIRPDHLKKHDA
jgi:nucleotide-binding universal stress UspA family protein